MSAKPSGKRTLDGSVLAGETLVNVNGETDSKGDRLLLVECPFCGADWRAAYEHGNHSLGDVETHILRQHARSIDSRRDMQNHELAGGNQ